MAVTGKSYKGPQGGFRYGWSSFDVLSAVPAVVQSRQRDAFDQSPSTHPPRRHSSLVRSLQVTCFRPRRLKRARGESGVDLVVPLVVPCGSCVGCRAGRAGDWALRAVHEASCHRRNSFVTLTYNDEEVPADGSVRVAVLQQFFKRLRKFVPPRSVRYLACGEYGEENLRPHYHAAIFGHGFDDRFDQVRDVPPLFRSRLLEKLWTNPDTGRSLGHSSVGELTYESAAYVARYVMKKLTGVRAEEYGGRKPPFAVMSLKPGLGASWFEKYATDVFPADEVVHDGRRHRVPRFYDKLFGELDESKLEAIKAKREAAAIANPLEQTDARLRVREGVVEARLKAFRRSL